jgi:hypothetical protein
VTLEDARTLLRALASERVDFVVIGSMAMAAQGLPRATRDIDFFVAPERSNLEALKRALRSTYDDPNVEQIDVDELAGPYPAVEYVPPHGRYSMDILTRLGEAFGWDEISEGSEEIAFEGVRFRVAGPRLLIRMKKDTIRPQDRLDAERIREAFGIEDV